MDGVVDKKASGLADSLDGKTRALTVVDVAELLNISERQVYKLVAEYRIPCFKIGGSIRFDPCAVAVVASENGGALRKFDGRTKAGLDTAKVFLGQGERQTQRIGLA